MKRGVSQIGPGPKHRSWGFFGSRISRREGSTPPHPVKTKVTKGIRKTQTSVGGHTLFQAVSCPKKGVRFILR